MAKKIYITTPLYYVNASPHIGHSYTNVAADCLARYYRQKGEDVFFLTGSDEHGQKIAQAADAAGKEPQAFVDGVVEHFESLWKLLNISHDDFIRTTQQRHVDVVQAALTRLKDEGKLTREAYNGWYCTPDETFWTPEELAKKTEDIENPVCPDCQRPLEAVQEEGWYLHLRESQEWLVNFLKKNPQWVRPESRYNEIFSLLKDDLPKYLCITRPKARVKWGIPVPFDPEYVTYVWFDALLNYLTATGYLVDQQLFEERWPAKMQIIGKDILRHHALYWPIMLHALGIPDDQMPECIFAHGWWKIGEQKMSKSLGNIVDPNVIVTVFLKEQPFAADVYRYFLMREVNFGQDGNFSEEGIETRFASDLANDLGNLVNRTLSMIDKYCDSKIPAVSEATLTDADKALQQSATSVAGQLDVLMPRLEFSKALEAIMDVVSQANRYIEEQMPWKLSKAGETERLHCVLRSLAETLRTTAILLTPFMPSVTQEIWRQLGFEGSVPELDQAAQWLKIPDNQSFTDHPVLFPRPKS